MNPELTKTTPGASQSFQQELVKVSKNAGIGGAGIVFGSVVTYLTTVFATRVVGAEKFGVFFLAQSILLTLVLVSTLGLNAGVLRYVSLYDGRGDRPRIKGTILFGLKRALWFSGAVALATFVAAPLLAHRVFDKPDLQLALRVLILALPLATAGEILLAGLQGLRLIAQNALVKNVLQPLLRLLLLAGLFALGLRFMGLVLAATLTFALSGLLAYHFLKKHSHALDRDVPARAEARAIRRFSRPLYWENLLNHSLNFLPVLVLGYFWSSAEVGVFGVVMRLALLVSLPLTAMNLVFAPTISFLYGRGEKEALARLFKTVTKWIFTVSLVTALVLTLFAEPILAVFGTEFVSGAAALYLVAGGELVNAGVGSAGYMLMMTGRPKINLLNAVILSALNLLLAWLLVPRYGVLGAAWANAVSVACINLLRLAQVYYYERIHPYKPSFLKPILAAVCSVALLLLVRSLYHADSALFTWGSLLLFPTLFTGCLLLLKLEREDRYILRLVGSKLKI